MVWLTSLDDDCSKGYLKSYSIFLLDLRKIGQSFMRWLVSLPRNMQYRGLKVYGPRPRLQPLLDIPLCDGSCLVFARGSLVSLLRRWPIIPFPIFRRCTTIRIDAMYLLGVGALVIIVMRWPWGLVLLWGFFVAAQACRNAGSLTC
jgi:hypothetical protein